MHLILLAAMGNDHAQLCESHGEHMTQTPQGAFYSQNSSQHRIARSTDPVPDFHTKPGVVKVTRRLRNRCLTSTTIMISSRLRNARSAGSWTTLARVEGHAEFTVQPLFSSYTLSQRSRTSPNDPIRHQVWFSPVSSGLMERGLRNVCQLKRKQREHIAQDFCFVLERVHLESETTEPDRTWTEY